MPQVVTETSEARETEQAFMHPPRRSRRGRGVLTGLLLVGVLAACGNDGDSTDEQATNAQVGSSTTVPVTGGETTPTTEDEFCSHVTVGQEVEPVPDADGNVPFVFTDLDDRPGAMTTIAVYPGTGPNPPDTLSNGQYCDWEQGIAICRTTGRAVRSNDGSFGPMAEQWVQKHHPDDVEMVTAVHIRNASAVLEQLVQCPAATTP